jgi:hypothetical protein
MVKGGDINEILKNGRIQNFNNQYFKQLARLLFFAI